MAEQPPSGGCVLKLTVQGYLLRLTVAATFGWLCVETGVKLPALSFNPAATFGWLCVETSNLRTPRTINFAATFGWLCVETCNSSGVIRSCQSSHLRVAVC